VASRTTRSVSDVPVLLLTKRRVVDHGRIHGGAVSQPAAALIPPVWKRSPAAAVGFDTDTFSVLTAISAERHHTS
jgi:hypothetical protein